MVWCHCVSDCNVHASPHIAISINHLTCIGTADGVDTVKNSDALTRVPSAATRGLRLRRNAAVRAGGHHVALDAELHALPVRPEAAVVLRILDEDAGYWAVAPAWLLTGPSVSTPAQSRKRSRRSGINRHFARAARRAGTRGPQPGQGNITP